LPGIDGAEDEELEFQQGEDEGTATLFEADGDGPSAESIAELQGPFIDGFRRVEEGESLA
jgi:hypothetical protein